MILFLCVSVILGVKKPLEVLNNSKIVVADDVAVVLPITIIASDAPTISVTGVVVFPTSVDDVNLTTLFVVPAKMYEVPEDPSVPLDPEVPDVPVVPLVPSVPEVPLVPVVPEVPLVPSVPEVPLVPSVPEVPDVPEDPDVPSNPLVPDVPSIPEVPDVPDVPDEPDVPLEPDVPDEPSPPAAPSKLVDQLEYVPDPFISNTYSVNSPVDGL